MFRIPSPVRMTIVRVAGGGSGRFAVKVFLLFLASGRLLASELTVVDNSLDLVHR